MRTVPLDIGKLQLTIVSPHRDDAAFSCGILLCGALAKSNITIVNVFTRSAYAPYAPEVERAGVACVSEVRLREDLQMIAALKSLLAYSIGPLAGEISEVDLGLLDAPLRLNVPVLDVQGETLASEEFEREVALITRVLSPVLMDADIVLLPLGLGGTGLKGHIDHQIARDAGLRCVALERVAFYEDLPYAARMSDALREAALAEFAPVIQQASRPLIVRLKDFVSIKASLAQQYRSQVDANTVEEMCAYAETRGGGEVIYAGAHLRPFLAHIGEEEGASLVGTR